MAGEVSVGNKVISKAGFAVPDDCVLSLKEHPRFVSRAGDKLEAAVSAFHLNIENKICADIGASTGGFTDCLLQHGAKRVFAVDVGHKLLHHSLANNPKVTILDGVNARFLTSLEQEPELVVIDCSFISLHSILPQAKLWMPNGGQIVTLIKPQFEANQKDVSRGRGVIQNPDIRRDVLSEILTFAEKSNFSVLNLISSPIFGKKGGNVEYLAHLSYPADGTKSDIPQLIKKAMGSNSL
jgi:23S rRNA (cytidine1920-2'-O)/16S rRNA (cytidine1409-2'-O)-methyltransferase